MALPAHFDLTGRKAMVLGVGHPAGAAIARAYAEAGADVALCALDGDDAAAGALHDEIEARGRRAPVYTVDVTGGEGVEAATQQIASDLGRLDIVASAPERFLAKPIEETTDSDLAEVLAVNFCSQFFVVRSAAARFRLQQSPGRIVLLTSVLGERSLLDVTAYASAHGAVYNLVRAAAHELAAEHITLNAISLGWMEWMSDRIDAGDENGRRALRFPLLRRAGRADEVGPLAVYLASETGADYITGQIFPVDGGLLQHQ